MRFSFASAAVAFGLLGTGLALPQQQPAVAPTPQQPTTQQPTNQQPNQQRPPTTNQPTTQQPTTQQPTTQKPTTQQPTTQQPTTAKVEEQIKEIETYLADAAKLLKEVATEEPAARAFLTQAAAVVEALEAGVKLITVKAPETTKPTENKPTEIKPTETKPNNQQNNNNPISNGIFRGEHGGNVYMDIGNGNTRNDVKNEVIKEIEKETLDLLKSGERTSAYDPEWEYEARELRKLFD